ncbi:MAG: hypothetical protein PHU96_06095 [Candidatus Omnitrophica bacterium]|nr:hypothetical protein [Candidatus Omnitrophota bacterium]
MSIITEAKPLAREKELADIIQLFFYASRKIRCGDIMLCKILVA